MMSTTTALIVVLAVLGVLLAYAVLSPLLMNLPRFAGHNWFFCPEERIYARVRLNSLGAALTSGYGAPRLHVRRCTLLRKGETCEERCLNGADL